MGEQGVSRRGVLKTGAGVGLAALVLGGGGFALHSCRRIDGLNFGEQGLDDAYEIWRQVRAALRTSPDHTASRAKALVAAGDVATIHRFVRDDIRLVSGAGHRFLLGSHVKWGARAALRAGAGTAREKAEILADLIRQTGREANVVELPEFPREDGPGIFYRDFAPGFAPQVGKEQVERWRKALGQPALDVDAAAPERETGRLAGELLAQIPEEQRERIGRHRYENRLEGYVPVVRFTEADGGELYADPIRPDAELVPVGTARERPARDPVGMLPVTVTLTATVLDESVAPYEIARAEWTADEVAGRQVRIGFKPFGDTQSVLASRIGDLRAFTPFLSIQALDGSALDPARAMVMGESFTLEGDRITHSDDGVVEMNGKRLGDGAASGRADDVASIEVEADAARFPDMRLHIRPKSSDGTIVDGLTCGDFALADEGERVAHLLHDRDRAPSILFLADASGSMPKEFIGAGAWGLGSAMQELIAKVETMAKQVHPQALVTVQSTDSNMWRHLLKNVGSSANLIIYATDGDLDGPQPTPEQIAALGTGPKAVVMDVRAKLESRRERYGEANIFDAMARATNGVALNVSAEDTAEVEEAIRRSLNEEARDLPYILSYRVLNPTEGTRKAGATIGKASGEASYEVGATAAPARKVAALHVTVRIGGHEIKRLLAGHDGRDGLTPDKQNELHGAMLGTHLLALEGPPPSVSTVLDDIITARLSTELLHKAARDKSKSLGDMLAALDKGFFTLPNEQAALLMRSAPLSGKDFAFAEQGMRAVLHSEYPIVNTSQMVGKVDILPFSHAHIITPDRAVLIEKAFNASLMLAAGEAALFTTSTAAALKGKPLALLTSELYHKQEPALDAEKRAAWGAFMRQVDRMFPQGHITVTAADASTQASWAVSRATGEIFALLPDGSGGGHLTKGLERQLADLDKAISLLNLLATGAGAAGLVNPVGGVALAIVAAYGQSLARLYAAASMSVMLMDTSGMDPIMRNALVGLACNVAKSVFLGVFSAAGQVATNAVNIFAAGEGAWGAAGGSSPTFCAI
jgi:hypothetical protein